MKAAVASDNGLVLADVPEPKPGPHEVLTRVRAAGLNRADLAAARGAFHPGHGTAGQPIGLEWAGDVVAVGAEVTEFQAGDRVMCSGIGGYAEYAASDIGRTLPLPDAMTYDTGATLPVALYTMHDALITNGRLTPGDAVLIQGASSGVGIMGLQIAKLKDAGLVIGSSTNAERRARLKEFGADVTIDTHAPDWPEQVRNATGGKGVNLIVDMLSGSAANGNMQACALLARIVNVGRLAGAKAEFDFDLHALKRIDYIGVTFRTRSVEEVREISRRMRADIWDAVTSGKLHLPIDRTFPLEEALAAQAHMRANKHFGKVLLAM
jgi:NADPH2:quinone reductase